MFKSQLMKKIYCFIAVLLITGAAFAQTDTSMQDTTGLRMMHDSMMQSGMQGMHGMGGKMQDCIMMMNGKPMVMKGGQHTSLNQQMTLPNGTVVMPDGTVKMADGTTRMLKNGECVYMDGTLGKMKMMKGGKNKKSKDMGSDSTGGMSKDSTRM
jgi:hypothetical protein